jgi:hypothetical protein
MMIDPEQHHHHHTGHRWVDMVVAISALVVSVVSLGVAIFHGRTMEQMADANARLVQANSWPFLQGVISNAGPGQAVGLGLRNVGVGPAKVHWMEVLYNGAPQSSMTGLLASCCGYNQARGLQGHPVNFNYSLVDETVLRAGEINQAVTFPQNSANSAYVPKLNAALPKVSYLACYCSVFDECWIGNTTSLQTRPVRSCPAPQVRFAPNR